MQSKKIERINREIVRKRNKLSQTGRGNRVFNRVCIVCVIVQELSVERVWWTQTALNFDINSHFLVVLEFTAGFR